MEAILATLETEISLSVIESVTAMLNQAAIDAEWMAGNTHAAARAYVAEYFRTCDVACPTINATTDYMRDEFDHADFVAVNVYFTIDGREHGFTVWFEPCVSRVYGEW